MCIRRSPSLKYLCPDSIHPASEFEYLICVLLPLSFSCFALHRRFFLITPQKILFSLLSRKKEIKYHLPFAFKCAEVNESESLIRSTHKVRAHTLYVHECVAYVRWKCQTVWIFRLHVPRTYNSYCTYIRTHIQCKSKRFYRAPSHVKSKWQAQMSGAKEKTEMEGETERERASVKDLSLVFACHPPPSPRFIAFERSWYTASQPTS